jgi:hypothetical protein
LQQQALLLWLGATAAVACQLLGGSDVELQVGPVSLADLHTQWNKSAL